jgi:hypothetical protein
MFSKFSLLVYKENLARVQEIKFLKLCPLKLVNFSKLQRYFFFYQLKEFFNG